ncbi:hypothetical protein MRX96_028335 [Rhipicephalus microplus]
MGEELRCLQMSTQKCRELPAMSSGLPQSPRHVKPLGPPKFGMPPTLWTKFGHLFLPGLGLDDGHSTWRTAVPGMPPNCWLYPMKLFTKKRGARQEPLWADMETDGSAGNAAARKPSSKAKSHTTQNIPIQEAAQSPGGVSTASSYAKPTTASTNGEHDRRTGC